MEKICPLMSKPIVARGAYDQDLTQVHYESCAKESCQLWIQVYSVEKRPFYCCVFEMMAMKNSEGLYRV